MFLELFKCDLDIKRSKNDYKVSMGGGGEIHLQIPIFWGNWQKTFSYQIEI